MFEVKNLSFSYQIKLQTISVLKNLNFKVKAGEFIGIQGPSGSGKSTLFYILGFLLRPTAGQVILGDVDLTQMAEDELTFFRNQKIGFIFQQFHLLSQASVLENILLPTRYPSEFIHPHQDCLKKAILLADRLGLSSHLEHFPHQLSGGQQQRVAIARALMNDVDLILADEPTGNLDSYNVQQILEIFSDLNRQGKTIILITHDAEVAKKCSKVYHLKDGALTHVVENFKSSCQSEKPIQIKNNSCEVGLLAAYQRIGQSVFPLVVENLLRNKRKSLLTMLGVVIGVAAVLAMVTLGQFTKKKILETYEALGVNQLLIRGYPNWNVKATDVVSLSFQSFDWERDVLKLQKIFEEIRYFSPVLTSWQNRVTAGGIEVSDGKVMSMGVSPEYLTITNSSLKSGRNINVFHVERRSPVCLIGFEIAERLFSRTHSLGQILTVSDNQRNSFPCQVIGVLNSKTSHQDWISPNLHILLPYSYFQTVAQGWSTQIHEVTLQVSAGVEVEGVGKKIKSYFEQKYGKSGQFYVDSDSTLIAQMKRFLNVFSLFLAAIACLSLAVGGIGIHNMMLVSVTERIKEFGLRKALGATHRSVRVQVLMESVSLCTTAGLLGVVFGFGSYQLMILGATQWIKSLKFEWVFEPVAFILSLLSILIVGIVSGLVPALKAEKLQIIEALRSE